MNFTTYYDRLTNVEGDWFAGENTCSGYENGLYYFTDETRYDRLYILKGTPGSGKSTFMKTVSENAKKNGLSVEKILCSSDPSSLDGIVIDNRTVIVDGTAPHTVEMTYPGVSSELIDLSEYLDMDGIKCKRKTVEELCDAKRAYYISAYKSLSLAGKMNKILIGMISTAIRGDKTYKFINKLITPLASSECPEIKRCFTKSIGMTGKYRLDTLEKNAGTVYYVNDHYGSCNILMKMIYDTAIMKDIDIEYSKDILGNIDEIYFPGNKLLVTVTMPDIGGKVVNMSRFVHEDITDKGKMKLIVKCRDAYIDDASEALREAGRYHFEIERIYGEFMDFSKVSERAGSLSESVIHNNLS